MSSIDLRRRRNRAIKLQHNRCYYCEKVMHSAPINGGTPNPLAATLEHLDDAWSPWRGRAKGRRVVAACYLCNYERSVQRQREALEGRDPNGLSAHRELVST